MTDKIMAIILGCILVVPLIGILIYTATHPHKDPMSGYGEVLEKWLKRRKSMR